LAVSRKISKNIVLFKEGKFIFMKNKIKSYHAGLLFVLLQQ